MNFVMIHHAYITLFFVLSGCTSNNNNNNDGSSGHRSSDLSTQDVYQQISLGVESTRQSAIDKNHHAICWANNNAIDGYPKKNNNDLVGQKFVTIAGAGGTLCAIDVQGKVQCIIPSESSKKTPSEIATLGSFSQVVSLTDRFCALTMDKEIVCHVVDFSTDPPADDFIATDEIIDLAGAQYLPAGGVNFLPFGCWLAKTNKLTCHPFADGPQAAGPAETAERIVKTVFNWVEMISLSTDKKNIKFFGQSRKIRLDHNIDLSLPIKEIATFRNHICVLTPNNEIKCGAFNSKTLSKKTDDEVKNMPLKTIHPGTYYCGQDINNIASCWSEKDVSFRIPDAIKTP